MSKQTKGTNITMLRLSKKGWNNILIFSMLLMIMVFNGLHKRIPFGKVEAQAVSLLPDDSLVLTLTFGDIAVERIGQSWRTNPQADIEAAELTQMMLAWKGKKAQWHQQDMDAKLLTEGKEPDYYVIATLAGKSDGAVYAFYPQLEMVWVHDQHQKRWLEITIEDLDTLIPKPLRP
jgi:hypothetical protein